MIYWLASIWTKPLATWTLLDLLGIAGMASAAYTVCLLGYLITSAAREPKRSRDRGYSEIERIENP